MLKSDKLNKKIYKNIIKNKKITQKEMAEKIGILESTLCRSLKTLESGKGVMTDTLFKIAYALDIEPAELFK